MVDCSSCGEENLSLGNTNEKIHHGEFAEIIVECNGCFKRGGMRDKEEIEEALNRKPFSNFLKEVGLGRSNGQTFKTARKVLEWVLIQQRSEVENES